MIDGKQRSLGYYSTEYEASLAYARYVWKNRLIKRELLPFTDEELAGYDRQSNKGITEVSNG